MNNQPKLVANFTGSATDCATTSSIITAGSMGFVKLGHTLLESYLSFEEK